MHASRNLIQCKTLANACHSVSYKRLPVSMNSGPKTSARGYILTSVMVQIGTCQEFSL